MNFRTELHPNPAAYKLDLTSKVVTAGSCFSDVIGRQLEKYKVETLTNPFGTLFNPLSVCKLLQVCAGADVELADSFVKNNGRWYSYDFHSSFSAETEEDLYEMLDEVIVKTRRFLKKADVLILTLGTANIFRLNITGETVANCHKLPAGNFTRETLLPEEIITGIAETHSLLRELNPNLKLVLTVSPVRHLKDTLELNSVSKAVLRLATHFLSQNLPEITYFPAYELLVDDLRDYRFYKEDLLHPTPLAETYIWQKFTGAYFENTFGLFIEEWNKILRAKDHKPFQPESPQHQAFIQETLEKLRILQDKVNVDEELAWFENQVILLPEPVEEADSEEEETEAETEEETIPGYFSEESAEAEVEEAEALAAALNEQQTPALPEEGAGRKKKKRKKKKKPSGAVENISLSEVGTAPLPRETGQTERPSEPTAELAEILGLTAHEIAHYGETLSEAPTEQVKALTEEARPIAPAKSKSAKRRESRRKKKAFAVAETNPSPAISEESTIARQPEENQEAEPTFAAENATVLTEETRAEAFENTPASDQEIPAKRPVKKRGGRNEKKARPELFAAPTAEPQPSETSENKMEPDKELPTPQPEIVKAGRKAKVPAEAQTKSIGKGRQPKATKLFNEAEPVTDHIAVPFVHISEMAETFSETPTPAPVVKPKRAAAAKPAKPVKPATKSVKETQKPVAEKEEIPKPEKKKAPARKPAAKAKPEVAQIKEVTPTETKAATKAKPGRKKKTTPEA